MTRLPVHPRLVLNNKRISNQLNSADGVDSLSLSTLIRSIAWSVDDLILCLLRRDDDKQPATVDELATLTDIKSVS
jgi:hypothetical protein